MLSFFNSPTYSDVLIKVEDTTFHGHRIVLHKCPYFSALFAANMVENQDKNQTVVKIDGITASCFEVYLRYMYGGTIPPLSLDEYFTILKETEPFLDTKFRNTICDILNEHPDNGASCTDAIDYLEAAAEYQLELRHLRDIHYSAFPVIYNLSYHAIRHLASQCDDLAYIPVVYWVASHPKANRKEVDELVASIPRPGLTTKLLDVLGTYQKVPALNHFILEMLRLALTDRSHTDDIFTHTYESILEMKHELDCGDDIETVFKSMKTPE